MIVILAGAPGAGKGTQADRLAEDFGCFKISTGDALRRQIREGTEVGRKAEVYLDEGRLVPDGILAGVLKAELQQAGKRMVLLDGYPRTLAQARALENMAAECPLAHVVHLDVPRQRLVARLSGRRVCRSCAANFHVEDMPPVKRGRCDRCGGELYQRSDDTPEKIKTRLDVYERQTSPVLDFYKKKGLYARIDADRPAFEVSVALKGLLRP